MTMKMLRCGLAALIFLSGAIGLGCGDEPASPDTHGIYLVPNPATLEALKELQRTHPNPADPTGYRVIFYDLPLARCRIAIFAQDGEEVREITHDGSSSAASWNLFAEWGRLVPDGIYHYVVRLAAGDEPIARGSLLITGLNHD
jgi:hypothetical protein